MRGLLLPAKRGGGPREAVVEGYLAQACASYPSTMLRAVPLPASLGRTKAASPSSSCSSRCSSSACSRRPAWPCSRSASGRRRRRTRGSATSPTSGAPAPCSPAISPRRRRGWRATRPATPRPAFHGGGGEQGGVALAFVRRGWENLDDTPRASLQRVEYSLADGRLERRVYPRLDGAAPLPATTVVDGVRRIRLRYRDREGEWRERWDPTKADRAAARGRAGHRRRGQRHHPPALPDRDDVVKRPVARVGARRRLARGAGAGRRSWPRSPPAPSSGCGCRRRWRSTAPRSTRRAAMRSGSRICWRCGSTTSPARTPMSPPWRATGTAPPRRIPLPGEGLAVGTIRDGGNCFNLNSLVQGDVTATLVQRPAAIEQFVALMRVLGLPEPTARRIAAAAADWIDSDDRAQPAGRRGRRLCRRRARLPHRQHPVRRCQRASRRRRSDARNLPAAEALSVRAAGRRHVADQRQHPAAARRAPARHVRAGQGPAGPGAGADRVAAAGAAGATRTISGAAPSRPG